MKHSLWLAKQSILLDAKFLLLPNWTITTKLSFLAAKYRLLGRHMFRKFEFGQSKVNWAGETIYYDTRFGLVGYQSMLTRPVSLFGVAGIGDFGTVIDCGANVGLFSKMIRKHSPRAEVYAIEPVPAIYDNLKRNTANDPKTHTFNAAVSDRSGHAKMTFDTNNSAVSRVSEAGSVDVELITLDDFVRDHGIETIDLLKIDTETFEAHVLRGAKLTLAKTKYLLIEITIEGNGNYTFSSLMSLLYSSQYDFQLLAFRNYGDTGEGRMPIMDSLLVNETLLGNRSSAKSSLPK
jgi:FkbM family methyltransferase